MERDEVIMTAAELYAMYGIRGVSMNNIATKLSVSKRTIYEEFENKERLLEECLTQEIEKLSTGISQLQASARSSLEALLLTYIDVSMFYFSFCPAFHRDLERFPKAIRIWDEFRDSFREQCVCNLRCGVSEGDIVPQDNYELVAAMLINQLHNMETNNHVEMVVLIIRGICTCKGVETVGRLINDII